jgi:enterochelin esterase-like enzyme
MSRALSLFAIVSLLIAPFSAGATSAKSDVFFDRTARLKHIPFPTLPDFEAALQNAALAPDLFWADVLSLQQMPLAFGATAVFLYRGGARTVAWIGDFSMWRSREAFAGRRVPGTDIWIATMTFPLDTRLDYRVMVDGIQQLDPLNPLIQQDSDARNSVLTMPAAVSSSWAAAHAGVPKGNLSQPIVIESENLGYAKRIQVYTPAAYERRRSLPVIYVTDGQEFVRSDMGAMPAVLDNLIAQGVIPPVIAVFVDPRVTSTGDNRRGPELLTNPRFQDFLTQELVPWIDARYPTRPSPTARAIVGISLGGLHATYTALRQPESFAMAGLLSPYYAAKPAILAEVEEHEPVPVKFFVSQGTFDLDVSNTRHLCRILATKEYDFRCQESHDGHSWGNWSRVLDDMLVFFFAGLRVSRPVQRPAAPGLRRE